MSLCIGNFDKSILPNSIVEAVTVPQKMYGVKFDGVNSAGVRTYDAARFVWEPSTATKAGKDSFLGIPMFNPRECITEYDIVEGKQKVVAYKGDSGYDTLKASKTGDVMMEFTRFYYYRPSETEWILSPEYIFGFKPAPAFYRDGKLLDKVYVGKYNLGIGYVSQSGVETLSNVGMNTIRTNLRSKGMYMWDLKWWETLKMLCLVKYANCDVQACNSAGYNSGNRTYPSGNADNVRGLDGSNTSIATNEACLTFGIENAYGNVWKFMDGSFCNDYYLYFKEVSEIANGPTSVADLSVYDKMANNIAVGGNNTELKTLTFNADYDYITAPQTFGDGPYNDCCWGQGGLREILVGGGAWHGGSNGLFAFAVHSAVGVTAVDALVRASCGIKGDCKGENVFPFCSLKILLSGFQFFLVGGNAWNGGSNGLFTFNVNNAVGITDVNNGSGVKCRNYIIKQHPLKHHAEAKINTLSDELVANSEES